MNQGQLVKRVESAIDDAIRQRMYGRIEVEFRAGYCTFLRTLTEEKLDGAENRNDRNFK